MDSHSLADASRYSGGRFDYGATAIRRLNKSPSAHRTADDSGSISGKELEMEYSLNGWQIQFRFQFRNIMSLAGK